MAKIRKLPIQAISRREEGLMSTLLPAPGCVFVSSDFTQGEPTVTTHYSRDEMYRYASFDGVGKPPHYTHFNEYYVLKIDDIYLMTMSVSPFGKQRLMEAFNATYGGLTFAEQWVKDSEIIKKVLKKERQLHKVLCLGIGYGMQAKKLVQTAYENGYVITFAEAKKFHRLYWSLFSGVARLGKILEAQFTVQGYLVNEFGYRLVPESARLAYNYWVQSSVSGAINLLTLKFFTLAPYVKYVSTLHDELILEIEEHRLQDAKAAMDTAVASLNADLNWTVNIRTGWAVGRNLYEAK